MLVVLYTPVLLVEGISSSGEPSFEPAKFCKFLKQNVIKLETDNNLDINSTVIFVKKEIKF